MVSMAAPDLSATATFSTTCSMVLMPLRADGFRLVPYPRKSPLGLRPPAKSVAPRQGNLLRGLPAQSASANGLHHDNSQPFVCGVLHATPAGLVVHVYIVVLDLSQGPIVVGIYNTFESFEVVVERESEVIKTPLSHLLLSPTQDAEVTHLRPILCVEAVQQVIVELVNLQPLQLFVEEPVEIFSFFDHSSGEFCSQPHSLAVTVFQGKTDDALALTVVVGVPVSR